MLDTGTTVGATATVVSRMLTLAERPHVLIGPTTSAVAAAILPITGVLDIMTISGTATSTAFRTRAGTRGSCAPSRAT